MKRLKAGDIIEIKTTKGYGYFQCMIVDKTEGDLIKVFNKVFENPESNLDSILSVDDTYFFSFPLSYALKRKLVSIIGFKEIETDFQTPLFMRTKHIIRGEFLGWHIVNTNTLFRKLVKELSEEEKKLSEFGIVNDTYLIEKLDSGWSPSNWE